MFNPLTFSLLFLSFLFFFNISSFVLVVKNKSLLTPSPNNKYSISLRLLIAVTFSIPLFFSEYRMAMNHFLPISYLFSLLYPFFIPSSKFEFIKQGEVSTPGTHVAKPVKIKFKQGFEKYIYIWWARYLLIPILYVLASYLGGYFVARF